MLKFKTISIDDRDTLNRYLFPYGENSCQHSFATMYCLNGKYGDVYCEKDGYLFILRSKRCTTRERVYLFPLGDITNREGLKRAVEEILADAHGCGCRLRFETTTRAAKDALMEIFPGRFTAESLRDYAEYIYTCEKLALLPGSQLASKRRDINTFLRDYGDRFTVEIMRSEHIPGVLSFQEKWLAEKMQREEDVQLDLENQAIHLGLRHFKELGLSGIVVFIDGEIKGYAYGAPLSESCYDVIIEKGDRSVPDIYRMLNRDLARICCRDYMWINREEDVGVEGLRKAKLSYRPDILLEKYLIKEAPQDE